MKYKEIYDNMVDLLIHGVPTDKFILKFFEKFNNDNDQETISIIKDEAKALKNISKDIDNFEKKMPGSMASLIFLHNIKHEVRKRQQKINKIL